MWWPRERTGAADLGISHNDGRGPSQTVGGVSSNKKAKTGKYNKNLLSKLS